MCTAVGISECLVKLSSQLCGGKYWYLELKGCWRRIACRESRGLWRRGTKSILCPLTLKVTEVCQMWWWPRPVSGSTWVVIRPSITSGSECIWLEERLLGLWKWLLSSWKWYLYWKLGIKWMPTCWIVSSSVVFLSLVPNSGSETSNTARHLRILLWGNPPDLEKWPQQLLSFRILSPSAKQMRLLITQSWAYKKERTNELGIR